MFQRDFFKEMRDFRRIRMDGGPAEIKKAGRALWKARPADRFLEDTGFISTKDTVKY